MTEWFSAILIPELAKTDVDKGKTLTTDFRKLKCHKRSGRLNLLETKTNYICKTQKVKSVSL